MSATTSDTKNTKKGAPEAPVYKAPEGFEKIQIDRPSYQAENFLQRVEGTKREVYTGPPLQGYLAAAVDFGDQTDQETGETRRMTAFVIKCTAPTKAFERIPGNADGKLIEVPAGGEVLLWPNVRLVQAIEAACGIDATKAANHPTHMIHLWIMPLSREPFKSQQTGEDRRMWSFDVRAQPQAVLRKGAVVLNILGAHTPQALPNGGEAGRVPF